MCAWLWCITFAACCSASQSCSICFARAVEAEQEEQQQQLLFTPRQCSHAPSPKGATAARYSPGTGRKVTTIY